MTVRSLHSIAAYPTFYTPYKWPIASLFITLLTTLLALVTALVPVQAKDLRATSESIPETIANPPRQPTLALIGFGTDSSLPQRYQDRANKLSEQKFTLLSYAEMLQRLIGQAKIPDNNLRSLRANLRRADQLEAEFKSVKALALRQQVIQVYHHTPRPSADLRELAARAMHAWAFALLTEGNSKGATTVAQDSWRKFPDINPHPALYAPKLLKWYKSIEKKLKSETSGQLIVISEPGRVRVAGQIIESPMGRVELDLPHGTYRLWVESNNKLSLPHLVSINEETTALDINNQLERCIALEPLISLRCSSRWKSDLIEIGYRLGVDQVASVSTTIPPEYTTFPHPLEQSHTTIKSNHVTTYDLSARQQNILWTRWLPLGIGQFSQQRPWMGTLFAALQGGALVWNLRTSQARQQAYHKNNISREQTLRTQQNLAAALVISSLLFGLYDSWQHPTSNNAVKPTKPAHISQ